MKINDLLIPARYPHYARMAWWRFCVPRFVKRCGVHLGVDIKFMGMPIVALAENSEILIEDRSLLCSDSRYTALGVNHPVVLRTLRPGARIHIGQDAGISGATICAAAEVVIGPQVLIGANALIVDTDFHPLHRTDRRYANNPDEIAARPVRISGNVFIGAGAFILKGVSVGKNSVIGAGAVVTSDVPENTIVAGNPARVVGNINVT